MNKVKQPNPISEGWGVYRDLVDKELANTHMMKGEPFIKCLTHEDTAIPLKELNEEIGNYPSPIAGCDEQFDYLLERRTKLEQRKHE